MNAYDPRRLSKAYRPMATAAGQARILLRTALADWGVPELYESASLVLTELISNAIRSADVIDLELYLEEPGRRLRIEVFDGGPGEPDPRDPCLEDENSRGLLLVDLLSAKWGHRLCEGGKVVFAILEPEAASHV